ncbi:MAG TPA: glycosyltransferase family 1 protein [Candidatus Angelobacter sp.]|nr:glycosyltransferase family 1 protein [Candidatus Angelobacter sp.]
MKIALDLRRMANPGIGRYMRCLTEALLAVAPEHEYLLILPPGEAGILGAVGATVETIAPELKYYSIREQIEIPRILRRHRVDLLHSPHFNLPLVCPCTRVVTIHDVIYLACAGDLTNPLGRYYYKAMMCAAVRVADRIVTDSNFSRDQIRRFLRMESEIEVIYPAVDSHWQPVTDTVRLHAVQARYGITSDYILYAGIFKPRKNHAGLLRAFRRFLDLGGDAMLVLAGPTDGSEKRLRKLAQDLKITDRIIFTGFVDDSDLVALYSGARVYACPSLYEGFGFTVLEAMACGVPVVSSAESSLPEVCGAAALYADARDALQFGDALYRASTDSELRRILVEKGYANVRRFDWRTTALQTLTVYQHAVGMPVVPVAYENKVAMCESPTSRKADGSVWRG